MAAEIAAKTDGEHMDLLGRLFAARGIDRFGVYLLTSERAVTPSGFEELSGYVIDPSGTVRFFWTGWDGAHAIDTLTTWEVVEVQPRWLEDEEFLDALGTATESAHAAMKGQREHELIEPRKAGTVRSELE